MLLHSGATRRKTFFLHLRAAAPGSTPLVGRWLDLSGLELSSVLVGRLGAALPHNEALEQLHLNACGLDDNAGSSIFQGAASALLSCDRASLFILSAD